MRAGEGRVADNKSAAFKTVFAKTNTSITLQCTGHVLPASRAIGLRIEG
jgi:hypothetical protein